MSLNLCTYCGVHHDNPDEHIFTYVESNDALNKRGLLDPITLEPFIDPVELVCGHTFSRSSIENVFLTKKECPECRRKVSKFHETSRIVREQLNQLEVWCPNKCRAHVERQSLTNHLTTKCPITKIFCLNKYKGEQCKFNGIRNELDKHEVECNFRILKCEGKCGVVFCEEPNHNCIHYLSQKSQQMIKLINQMQPQLNTVITQVNDAKLNSGSHGLKLFLQERKIEEQDTKLQEQNTILRTQDTKILILEKRAIIQGKKINSLITEVQVLTKEYHDNKFKILKENAIKGDILSQIQVGKIFEYGNEYVTKNEPQAKLWYEKAQAQDSKMAMQCLKSLEKNTSSNKRALLESETDEKDEKDEKTDDNSITYKKQKTDYGFVFGKSLWDKGVNFSKSLLESKTNEDTK